jgi:hypothetical protein
VEVHPLWKTASIGCLGLSMALLPGAAFAQWVQLGADIDGEAILDESGWSVSFSADGSRVAIGAPKNDGNGTDSGHVRVYQWVDPNWVQLGNDINGKAQNDLCGTSVSLSADGSRVAIGAPKADHYTFEDVGRVRVYEWFKWTSTSKGARHCFADFSLQLSSWIVRVRLPSSSFAVTGRLRSRLRVGIEDWLARA